MNGSIRVSAKTVDDAITEALIQLGVTSDCLEYEVIEKGSAGFLGIGMKQAVIEARRKPGTAEEEEDTKIRFDVTLEPEKKGRKEKVKEHKKEKREPEKKAEPKAYEKQDAEKELPKEEKKEEVVKAPVEKEESVPARKEKETAVVTEESKKAVEAFLLDTLKAMGMEVEIASEVDADGALSIDMKGENMGILIGKRGQTLDSVSCKPCGKQTSERICESETGYGKLSCEKRRDAEASRKEYRTQGKKKQKAGFFRTDESV